MKRPPPTYPANQEQFQQRLEVLRGNVVTGNPMMKMPIMVKQQCVLVLCAYYGSRGNMVRGLIKEWWWHWRINAHHRAILWISDRMGWTRLHWFPRTPTSEQRYERHGRQCSGSPNCQDVLCSSRSMPRWFKRVTGYERLYR